MKDKEKKYRTEHWVGNFNEAVLSLCSMIGGCGCMTYSIQSEDGTHFVCAKCGNTK